jgi:hypothetical protein
MPDQDQIEQQQKLLAAHRRTLAHYLEQEAVHGKGHVPPAVAAGIAEARSQIKRAKSILREWGVGVEDYPDDETPRQPSSDWVSEGWKRAVLEMEGLPKEKKRPKILSRTPLALLALLILVLFYFGSRTLLPKEQNVPPAPTFTLSPTEETGSGWPVTVSHLPPAGTQLNFSPRIAGWGIDHTKIPEKFRLRPSPLGGIYLSELTMGVESVPSWIVYYSHDDYRPAQSDTCLENIAPSGNMSGPLNIKVDDITLGIMVYVDDRYSLQINDIQINIVDFVSQHTEIDHVRVGDPGADGFPTPFLTVATSRAFVDGIKLSTYKVDFPDFTLNPHNGVMIAVPITMIKGGDYQFVLKVNGVATAVASGDRGGPITLTSSGQQYGWANLDDPRKYKVTNNLANGDNTLANLVQCT